MKLLTDSPTIRLSDSWHDTTDKFFPSMSVTYKNLSVTRTSLHCCPNL